ALTVAQACDDFPLQVVTRLRVGQAYLSRGNYYRAIECFQNNVRLLEGDLLHERFGEAWLPSVVSRSWLVFALGERGEFAEGIATAEEGLRIADIVGQPLTVINACRALGQVYLRKGDLNSAIGFLERAREMCQAWNVRRPQIPTYLGH